MKFTRGRKFRPIYRPLTLLHSHGVVRSAALFALAGLLLGSSAQLSGAQSDSEKRPAQKAGASAKSKSKDKNAQANLPAVLVYPPDSKGSASAPLVDVVTEVEQSRLMTSGSYRGLLYQRSMPSIRRAVLDQTLSAEAVHPPFDDNAKVTRLTRFIGYSLLLVGSIESYEYDADKKQVSLILSGRLMDISGEKPRVLRSSIISEQGPANPDKSAKEETLAPKVAREAAEKLMTDLLQPVKPAPSEPKTTETK